MSGVFPSPDNILCPCAKVEIDGWKCTLSYTLHSMMLFEARTGQRGPTPELDSLRSLIWSMIQPHPEIDERTVGQLDAECFARAVDSAAEIIQANRLPPRESETKRIENPDKPTDWYSIWSTGRIDMGLSEAEFWGLAPIQFDALSRRLEEQRDDRLYGHAMVAAQIYNSNRTAEDQPVMTPDAYMPNAAGEAARKQMIQEQRAGLHDKIMTAAKVLKAQVIRKK